MRRVLIVGIVAAALLALVPNSGEAFGRKNRTAKCLPACPLLAAPAPCFVPVCPLPAECCPQTADAIPSRQPSEANTVTIKGKSYRIVPHPDKGDSKENDPEATTAALPNGAGSSISPSDLFSGTSRRLAKTTIFVGPVETFDTVAALLDALPPNDEMVGTINNAAGTNRTTKEKRNVRVKAFIYAFKKEGDKDYHVIIGDSPDTPNLRYLNTEISGIPIGGTDENRAAISTVRSSFKSAFALGNSGPNSYFRPNPPVPVLMTGSLFWDVDHQNPPYVGPSDFKPKTPWEIHPISELEFIDP